MNHLRASPRRSATRGRLLSVCAAVPLLLAACSSLGPHRPEPLTYEEIAFKRERNRQMALLQTGNVNWFATRETIQASEFAALLQPPGTPLRVVVPPARQFTQATAIYIERTHFGDAVSAAVTEAYALILTTSGYAGEATLSGDDLTQSGQASVPAATMRQFLLRLANVGVTEREYVPWFTQYHSGLGMTLRVSVPGHDEPVVLFTRTHGRNGVPWGVQYDGRTYVVETADVGIAVRSLDPYLLGPRVRAFSQMIDERKYAELQRRFEELTRQARERSPTPLENTPVPIR